MMMPPQMGAMAPINGGFAPMAAPAEQMMPQMPEQLQQDLHPQMRAQLISALENFASR